MSTRSDFKGDYMGFTFNGVHSSELGIVRTSNGSRFDENLLPTIQDKTVQVPGGDGTYYFGSYYTQRQLAVSFAFDDLTEKQIEEIRAWLGDKKIHNLVFDERPYKAYRAKVTSTATIKYIPFNEGEGRERVYQGEGSIYFTAYFPYAVCDKKFLSNYRICEPVELTSENYIANKYYVLNDRVYEISTEEFDSTKQYCEDVSNTSEWAEASGLKEYCGDYDQLKGNEIKLYNPGVKESDCVITLKTKNNTGYSLFFEGDIGITLEWPEGTDKTLRLDSKNNLVIDVNTGEILNEYITEGDFFKIPLGESALNVEEFCADTAENNKVTIDYNYYYF